MAGRRRRYQYAGERMKQQKKQQTAKDFPVGIRIFGTLVWLTLGSCIGLTGWVVWQSGGQGLGLGIIGLFLVTPILLAYAVREAWGAWNKWQRTPRKTDSKYK